MWRWLCWDPSRFFILDKMIMSREFRFIEVVNMLLIEQLVLCRQWNLNTWTAEEFLEFCWLFRLIIYLNFFHFTQTLFIDRSILQRDLQWFCYENPEIRLSMRSFNLFNKTFPCSFIQLPKEDSAICLIRFSSTERRLARRFLWNWNLIPFIVLFSFEFLLALALFIAHFLTAFRIKNDIKKKQKNFFWLYGIFYARLLLNHF